MLINLVGFAGIGVTSSVVLAYYTPLGPVGLWWGLVIGLGVVALILMLRVRQLLRRPLARLHVER
jgi:MATE family multidrug resistance protein